MNKLSPNFLNELFKLALKNKSILSVCVDVLEYQFLPTVEYKELWRAIKETFQATGIIPTYGILHEQLKGNANIIKLLISIKDSELIDQVHAINQLEEFTKKSRFLSLHNELAELWKKGKQDTAIDLLIEEAESIGNFSLQKRMFESIFRGFGARYYERAIENAQRVNQFDKCAWGIHSLDKRTLGGVDKTDIALITARSGVGKSKALKHIAYHNARLGKRIIHFQLEGSKREATNAYDTMMAGTSLKDMELTTLEEDFVNRLIEEANKVTGDIHIVAYERFDTATLVDIRQSILEYNKTSPYPADGVVIDYIDKADPGNGKRYSTNVEGEKARRQALSDGFKNIAIELNLAGFTATQASNVPKERWNNPQEVITRNDVRGDKNVTDPYSYHITLNQTLDEKKNRIMRLYEDKVRKYEGEFIHKIATAYHHEKFYDAKRTLDLFGSK